MTCQSTSVEITLDLMMEKAQTQLRKGKCWTYRVKKKKKFFTEAFQVSIPLKKNKNL